MADQEKKPAAPVPITVKVPVGTLNTPIAIQKR